MPVAPLTTANIQVIVKGFYTPFAGTGKPLVFSHFYQCTPAGARSTVPQFCTAWRAAVVAAWQAFFHTDYLGGTIYGRLLDLPTNPTVGPNGAAMPGLVGTGDSVEPDAACYLYKKTALRGKEYRGSFHLSIFPELFTTNSNINVAGKAAADALCTALMLPIVDAVPNTWTPQLLSAKQSDLTLPAPTIFFTPLTSIVTCQTVGTMKRRKQKGVYA